jgi:FKBP-type peptidyl-prolyl cis-trans isomerase (trigger factor)
VVEFREQAEQDVRRSLILREIIRREGLELTPEDATAELERFLDDYGPERREEIRPLLQTPHMATAMASSALDRKLRDRLVSIATGQVPATTSAPVAAAIGAYEQSEPEVVGAGEADQVEGVSTVEEGK